MRIKKSKVLQVTTKEVEPEEVVEDYEALVRELYFLNRQRLEIENREGSLKKQIAEYVDKTVTANENGDRVFEILGTDGKPIKFKREIRRSYSVNETRLKDFIACSVDEEIAATLYSRLFVVTQVEKLDETELEAAVVEGIISQDDFNNLLDVKETYASKFETEGGKGGKQ